MKIVDNDSNTKKLIELGLSLPIIEVITDDDISDFSEDDGGYWEKNITSKLENRLIWESFHTSKLCKGHFWRHLAHQNYRIVRFEGQLAHQN